MCYLQYSLVSAVVHEVWWYSLYSQCFKPVFSSKKESETCIMKRTQSNDNKKLFDNFVVLKRKYFSFSDTSDKSASMLGLMYCSQINLCRLFQQQYLFNRCFQRKSKNKDKEKKKRKQKKCTL